ncbi:sulfite reductase beta subunit-like hemoprotein [Lachnospiraceae bacterium PF1-21]|uniref:Nitrite/sulfite reductase n=1 Tax=Ohessyouella blattaphilus TaxID=2949333 RepID=A0ABT1EKF8_9FIRM|nr:nitrite/sulfite reductase [Ohessyouella blattaphilus]MCP1111180.1 nitrite/sulfite reductase [Ohessyouella blattaphilus]MCR8564574.1 nitrite/sulfite reductase [Ohessyouella blattaphilus]
MFSIEQYKQELLAELPRFREQTQKFVDGELTKLEYKKISGGMGVYAMRDGKHFMLRLRVPSGVIRLSHLELIKEMIADKPEAYLHFTTRQATQVYNLSVDQLLELMEVAITHDIYIRGGGGNFPRNVLNDALSGFSEDSAFDVAPYAIAADHHYYERMLTLKLPRKYKVSFSSSPAGLGQSTIQEVGFVAKEKEGEPFFDVYIGGGLGPIGKTAFKVKEDVPASQCLYYIDGMLNLFIDKGHYDTPARARIRYLVDEFGEEGFAKLFMSYVEKELAKGGRDLYPDAIIHREGGEKTDLLDERIIWQKQAGLYGVRIHPEGGVFGHQELDQIIHCVKGLAKPQLRLSLEESLYILDVDKDELPAVLALADKVSVNSKIESTIACIGSTICQVGLEDAQQMAKEISRYFREKGADPALMNALPVIRISGCRNSCGGQQVGGIGLYGMRQKIEGEVFSAYFMSIGGSVDTKETRFGEDVGVYLAKELPMVLYKLAQLVVSSGKSFAECVKGEAAKAILAEYNAQKSQ